MEGLPTATWQSLRGLQRSNATCNSRELTDRASPQGDAHQCVPAVSSGENAALGTATQHAMISPRVLLVRFNPG